MADPVADFLAREQDLLAEIDGAPAPAAAAAVNPPVPPPADDFGGLMGPPSVGGGDSGVDLAGLDYQATPPVPLVNGTGVNSHQSAASSKGTSPVPSVPRIEAENIRRWREQQKILLEKKDEAEEKKKNELRNAAKKELEDWYKQREAALKLTKEANRKAEQEHLAAFGREQGEGAQWDEIARLCEAKAAQKGGKDVSRLKSLLLHLKDQNQNRKWVFFSSYSINTNMLSS
ncbi:clathrin light chain [Teladorsagia circumcincta]|uniref:Clathrin light chain n=1 Tax=Teladorsagia circumcincta TaxID=45464 RepID=A0A2G9V1W9_TELCI|nr:clathrin light chain [Teladorsagia circumcincta]